MAVVIPPHVTVMGAGLAAQCSELVKENYNVIPTCQVLINNLAFVISSMEPAAARETVIGAFQRDLPGMVDKLADARRMSRGGIIMPGIDDKAKLGG